MSSMLRNLGGNGTEPTMLAYQLKKGMNEIRNVMKNTTVMLYTGRLLCSDAP